MIRWLLAVVLAAAASAAEPAARYLEILAANPASETAISRLWEGADREAALEGLRELAGRNPAAHLALADFLARSGEPAAPALAKVPIEALDERGLIRLGQLWRAAGEPRLAREAWQRAVERRPNDTSLRRDLAAACAAAGDQEAARSHLAMLAEDPDPALRLEALELLADSFEAEGLLADASDTATRASEALGVSHWKFARLTARAIDLARRSGRLTELEERWAGAAREPASLRRRAALAMQEGRIPEAVAELEAAAKMLPAEPAIWKELGLALLALGRPAEAADALTKACQRAPYDQEAVEALAEALALDGREAEAACALEDGLPHARRVAALRRLGLREGLEKTLAEASGSPPATLEYAAFLLDEGRPEQAIAALRKTASAFPEFSREAARFLKSRGLLIQSEVFARELFNSKRSEENAILLAEILQARGESPVPVLREATASPSERLDRMLFEAVQKQAADPTMKNLETREEARELAEAARAARDPALWLRAARWAAWSDDHPAALLAEACEAHPDSPELRRELALALEREGELDRALREMGAVRSLLGNDTVACDRELARLELARGNPDAAVATLQTLAREHPRDAAIARELAAAQEAAGNTFEGLESWKRAFELAPAADRLALLRPTLGCYTKLGQTERAFEFLERAVSALPAGSQRRDWARAAAVFARAQLAEEAWTARLEKLAPASADFAMALAEMKGIPPPSERTSKLEDELAAAEKAREWGKAAELAGRLARMPSSGASEGARHARALERAGNQDAAEEAWRALAARYQRHASLQAEAATFFEGIEDPDAAEAAWRRAAALGPVPPRISLELARLDLANGKRSEALNRLKRLLAATPVDLSMTTLPPPVRLARLPGRLPSTNDSQGARFQAMWELGKLLSGLENAPEEIRAAASEHPVEPVWGLAGAGRGAMAVAAALPFAGEQPEAFAALALEFQKAEALRSWIDAGEPPASRWKQATSVAGQLLANGWMPGNDVLRAFDENTPAFARWDLAESLAAAGHYRLAAKIEVPAEFPRDEQIEALCRRAQWHLVRRDAPAALASLDRAIALGPATASLTDPFYGTLRARTLLDAAPALPEGLTPVERRAAQFLLSALAGEQPDPSEWAAVAPAGTDWAREANQLDGWHLGRAAGAIYAHAIAQAPLTKAALVDFLAASRIARATPAEAAYLTKEWLAAGGKPDAVAAVSARLAGQGAIENARAISEAVFEVHPEDPNAWGQLLALSSLEGGFSEKPTRWLEEHPLNPNTTRGWVYALLRQSQPERALQLARKARLEPMTEAEILMRMNQPVAARELLARANPPPGDAARFRQLARTLNVPIPRELLDARTPLETLLETTEPADAALARFIKARKPASERLLAIERLAESRPDLLASASRQSLDALLSVPRRDPSFRSRLALARLAIAQARGEMDAFEAELLRAVGDPIASEMAIRVAAQRNDATAVEKRVAAFLDAGNPPPPNLSGLARFLLASGQPVAACMVLERLDASGIPDTSLACAYARALLETGQTERGLALADELLAPARLDPQLQTALAELLIEHNQPDRATKCLERIPDNPVTRTKAQTLKTRISAP